MSSQLGVDRDQLTLETSSTSDNDGNTDAVLVVWDTPSSEGKSAKNNINNDDVEKAASTISSQNKNIPSVVTKPIDDDVKERIPEGQTIVMTIGTDAKRFEARRRTFTQELASQLDIPASQIEVRSGPVKGQPGKTRVIAVNR